MRAARLVKFEGIATTTEEFVMCPGLAPSDKYCCGCGSLAPIFFSTSVGSEVIHYMQA